MGESNKFTRLKSKTSINVKKLFVAYILVGLEERILTSSSQKGGSVNDTKRDELSKSQLTESSL